MFKNILKLYPTNDHKRFCIAKNRLKKLLENFQVLEQDKDQ